MTGGGVAQSRFGAWRYPCEFGSGNSGYLKDIDTGIFVEGFDGELVVASTMTATNDNLYAPVNYSTKVAGARFDFWALFPNESGDVQYKKLDDLTQTKGGFNNDGYANEVAVLAADVNGICIWMYQLEYKAGSFTIRTIKDKTTIFSYNYPDYFKTWSYNGWNRAPGADILAGDFDGDGETELAVIFQGDFPSSERNVMMFGGTVKTLHTNLYKWDNNTGDLKVTPNEVKDCSDMELNAKAFTYNYYSTIGRHNYWFDKKS